MIRTYTLLTLMILAASATFAAADHNRDSLAKSETAIKAQPWEKAPDLVNGHIAHDKLSSMKNRTQALINILHDSCFSGGSAVWHGEYFSGSTLSGSLLRFAAQCSFYGQDKSSGTKADLMILANDLSPLLDRVTLNNNDYFTINANISNSNGCLYFEQPKAVADGGATSFWLVAADNSNLPYLPVTRKEYLLEAHKELVHDTAAIAAEWRSRISVRSSAEQEAEKAAEMQHLKTLYSGAELQARIKIYQQNYSNDETTLQENTDKATAIQRDALQLIDDLLHHMDSVQLLRPAYIAGQDAQATDVTLSPAASFQGFQDGRPGATLLVKLNPACFNGALGEDKPQFFLVGWRLDPNEPQASDLDRQFHANFDGQKLKELLGK